MGTFHKLISFVSDNGRCIRICLCCYLASDGLSKNISVSLGVSPGVLLLVFLFVFNGCHTRCGYAVATSWSGWCIRLVLMLILRTTNKASRRRFTELSGVSGTKHTEKIKKPGEGHLRVIQEYLVSTLERAKNKPIEPNLRLSLAPTKGDSHRHRGCR